MKEIPYLDTKVKLDTHIYDISDIKLKICCEKLANGITWDDFFVYKMIKSVRIEYNGMIIFQTNGLFIKTKIDIFEPEFKKMHELINISKNGGEFIVPLFINPIPCCFGGCTIEILLDEELTHNAIKLFVMPMYKKPINPKNDLQQKITENNLEKIYIEPYMSGYDYKVKTDGLINYLIIIVDGNFTIDTITCSVNGQAKTYTYTELNKIIPYFYLNKCLEKEYMYIDFGDGINLSRIDQFKLKFTLKNNDEGGFIYLLSEHKNIAVRMHGMLALGYSIGSCFDTECKFSIPSIDKKQNEIEEEVEMVIYI